MNCDFAITVAFFGGLAAGAAVFFVIGLALTTKVEVERLNPKRKGGNKQ